MYISSCFPHTTHSTQRKESMYEAGGIFYMKATGIVRRIDDLGRVVIPKEIRRTLHLREGEPMEIFTGKDGEVILKKYSPVGELSEHAVKVAETVSQITGYMVCVTDCDQMIAACGPGSKEYLGQPLSEQLETLIQEREGRQLKTGIPLLKDKTSERDRQPQIICPIIQSGDVHGAAILCGRPDKPAPGQVEVKILMVAAGFLAKQME